MDHDEIFLPLTFPRFYKGYLEKIHENWNATAEMFSTHCGMYVGGAVGLPLLGVDSMSFEFSMARRTS